MVLHIALDLLFVGLNLAPEKHEDLSQEEA